MGTRRSVQVASNLPVSALLVQLAPERSEDGFRIPVPQPKKNPTRTSWIFFIYTADTTLFARKGNFISSKASTLRWFTAQMMRRPMGISHSVRPARSAVKKFLKIPPFPERFPQKHRLYE
jgi:hypothetical protein